MKSSEAQALLTEIDLTIKSINSMQLTDPLQLSFLAKYLVVFVCGIYEEAIEIILRQKFARLKSKYISTYLSDRVSKSFRNPDFSNICELLGSFNKNWEKKIKKLEIINKDAITSLVNLKNGLAHTGTTTVTWSEGVQYYNDSKIIIEEIDKMVL